MPFDKWFKIAYRKRTAPVVRELASATEDLTKTTTRVVQKTGLPPSKAIRHPVVAPKLARVHVLKKLLRKSAVKATAAATVPTVIEEHVTRFARTTGLPYRPDIASKVAADAAAAVVRDKAEYAEREYVRRLADIVPPAEIRKTVRPMYASVVSKYLDAIMLEEDEDIE